MGVKTPDTLRSVRLPCAGGLVRLTGPGRLATVLAELLATVRIPTDAVPVLDVTVSPDARTADGVADGRLMWSISIPPDAAAAALMGQIVGTLTTLLTRLLFVHAGVVAFEGRGAILVGESGAGKTSTVAALVHRGATYLSDEVALLDPAAGTVIPFSLPMAVKPWTRRAAGVLPPGRAIAREDGTEFWLPDRLERSSIAIDTFVLLRHDDPATRLRPISRAAMLLALGRHASSFKQQHRVHEAFAGFSRLLRTARTMVFDTPRPAAHADQLAALWSRPSRV